VAVSNNQIVLFRCGIIDKTVMYEAETGRWHEKCYTGKVSTLFFHNNFCWQCCIFLPNNKEEIYLLHEKKSKNDELDTNLKLKPKSVLKTAMAKAAAKRFRTACQYHKLITISDT
jgi:hypothetical protein